MIKKVKSIYAIISNIIILSFVIFALFNLNYLFIVDKKCLLFPVLVILALKIIRTKLNKKYQQSDDTIWHWIIHCNNIINVGYLLSLVYLALYVGKDYYVKSDDFPSYLMLFLPSILYVFSDENINNLLKIFKFDSFD